MVDCEAQQHTCAGRIAIPRRRMHDCPAGCRVMPPCAGITRVPSRPSGSSLPSKQGEAGGGMCPIGRGVLAEDQRHDNRARGREGDGCEAATRRGQFLPLDAHLRHRPLAEIRLTIDFDLRSAPLCRSWRPKGMSNTVLPGHTLNVSAGQTSSGVIVDAGERSGQRLERRQGGRHDRGERRDGVRRRPRRRQRQHNSIRRFPDHIVVGRNGQGGDRLWRSASSSASICWRHGPQHDAPRRPTSRRICLRHQHRRRC